MRTCQIEDAESQSLCGRPAYTNASNLCLKHYGATFPASFNRLQKNPQEPDHFKDFQEDNKTHPIPQMLFAFKMMWKMRKFLGGENRLEYWFKFNYGDNPNYRQAIEMIRKMKWDHETGTNPIEQAFETIG